MDATVFIQSLAEAFQQMGWVEIGAVCTGLIYVILATQEQIACWFFGIISSILSIYLFFTGKLYAEAILYGYYVIAGFYGWYSWSQHTQKSAPETTDKQGLEISTWKIKEHFIWIGIGFICALLLFYILKTYTDASMPLVDSFTTIFAFIATYMTTRKILENWLYWIIIDLVSIYLYASKGYNLYAFLMFFYTILAIFGYFKWKREYR